MHPSFLIYFATMMRNIYGWNAYELTRNLNETEAKAKLAQAMAAHAHKEQFCQ